MPQEIKNPQTLAAVHTGIVLLNNNEITRDFSAQIRSLKYITKTQG